MQLSTVLYFKFAVWYFNAREIFKSVLCYFWSAPWDFLNSSGFFRERRAKFLRVECKMCILFSNRGQETPEKVQLKFLKDNRTLIYLVWAICSFIRSWMHGNLKINLCCEPNLIDLQFKLIKILNCWTASLYRYAAALNRICRKQTTLYNCI